MKILLLCYRVEELAEMSRDIFDDRSGTEARQAFVHHQPASHRLPLSGTIRTGSCAVVG